MAKINKNLTAELSGLLKWIPNRDGWHLYNAKTGKFLNEFYGCDPMSKFFLDAIKGEDNFYELTCTKITKQKQEAKNGKRKTSN